MDVRQVRPTDAPLVLSLAIDEASHLVKGRDWPAASPVLRTAARTALPLAVPGKSWIARDGPSVALLEAEPRQYVIGWDVTRLAARGENCEVLAAVAQAAVTHLQTRGVPRLFARCEEEASTMLKEIGFHALAQEYVLLGPAGQVAGDIPLPVDSRYRMPPDNWPLHQLEVEITPSLVRQIEGLTSLDWSRRNRETKEIVVERHGRIVAWIGWGAKVRPGLVKLGTLVHPGHKDLAPDLLHHALKTLPPNSRFVARVRSYHPELLRTFQDAGFRVMADQVIMVKHAEVEVARTATARMRVVNVPGIQALPIQLKPAGRGPAQTRSPQE